MKKRFLIGSTLALSLFVGSMSVYASPNDSTIPELETETETSIETPELRDVVFINNDLCVNSSYQRTFNAVKDNGSIMQMNFDNSTSSVQIWVKIKINGNYVYSKYVQPGESAVYKANAANGKYEISIETPSGARMRTFIKARQY